MHTKLPNKNREHIADEAAGVAAPSLAARRRRKITLTCEEAEGYKRLLAAPEPPTEKLRYLLLERRGMAPNEI